MKGETRMAKKEKTRGFLKEFKEFALKGSLFDMAIGVIIGGVFKDLVDSFTKNLIMPIISIFTGSVDFSSWKIALPSLFGEKVDPETGLAITNYLCFGDFLSSVISFLILALVIFLMVKGMNKLRSLHEKPKAPEKPAEPTAQEKLLAEIRDLLKEQQR